MNRQHRRLLQQQGRSGEDGETFVVPPVDAGAEPEPAAERRARPVPGAIPGAPKRRTSPRQFLHEVNVEMRKVAWPTASETANYSTVVFITLAILMALIFGLDLLFSKLSIFLFK